MSLNALILRGEIAKVTFKMFNKIMYHVAFVSFLFLIIVLKSRCNSSMMDHFTVQNSIVGP